jgi:hypothetical protein
MKKLLIVILAGTMLSGCATITNGHITDCQKTKPAPGQPCRQVKIWAIIFDGPIGLIIDFADGAIYKKSSCDKK